MTSTLTPPRERDRRSTGSGTGDAWRVIVLNDNHNTFEGVAFALASTIPGIDYDKGMAARDQDRRDRPGDRLVGRPRARRALPLPARGPRPDDGPARAIDARRRHPSRLRRLHRRRRARALRGDRRGRGLARAGDDARLARVPRPRGDLRPLPRDAPPHRRHVPERAALGAGRRRPRRRRLPGERQAPRPRDRHRPGCC